MSADPGTAPFGFTSVPRFEHSPRNLMAEATAPPSDTPTDAPAADDPALQRLLASPKLALYHDAFEQLLEKERAARERFYEETDASTKAEFINGEVVMSSPARVHHIRIKKRLEKLLDTYVETHDLGEVLGEKALVSLTRNDYEPDLAFFGNEKAADIAPDQWKLPAPDFACEILSSTTEARDRGVKFEDYAAHGVGEYWVVDPRAETAEQYILKATEGEVAAGEYALREGEQRRPRKRGRGGLSRAGSGALRRGSQLGGPSRAAGVAAPPAARRPGGTGLRGQLDEGHVEAQRSPFEQRLRRSVS